jgi:hypothetical protein
MTARQEEKAGVCKSCAPILSKRPKAESPALLRNRERVKSVEALLLKGDVSAALQELGVSRQRLGQLITADPELHYLSAAVRRVARDTAVQQLLQTWFDSPAETSIDELAKAGNLSKKILDKAKREEAYIQEAHKRKAQIAEQRQQELINQVRLQQKSVSRVADVLGYGRSIRQAVFTKFGATRKRRSPAQIELQVQAAIALINYGWTLHKAAISVAKTTSQALWLKTILKKRAESDDKLARQIQENRLSEQKNRKYNTFHRKKSYDWTVKDDQKMREHVLNGKTLKAFAALSGACYASILRHARMLSETDEEFRLALEETRVKSRFGKNRQAVNPLYLALHKVEDKK